MPKRTQLTKNFNIKEFDTKDGTKVPAKYEGQVKRLCEWFLEPMRKKFGACVVLSGYRHEAYNRAIGGARFSFHVYDDRLPREGVAADVLFAKGNPKEWASYARRLRARNRKGLGGVGYYPNSGFVHVDSRDYKSDWTG